MENSNDKENMDKQTVEALLLVLILAAIGLLAFVFWGFGEPSCSTSVRHGDQATYQCENP